MENDKLFRLLLFASLITSIIIFSIVGYLIGYFSNYDAQINCLRTPLNYGIGKINELNKDSFYCTCTSISGKGFSFTENNVTNGLPSPKNYDPPKEIKLPLIKNE